MVFSRRCWEKSTSQRRASAQLVHLLRDPLKQPDAQFGVGLLAAAEVDDALDLVSVPEEPLDVPH